MVMTALSDLNGHNNNSNETARLLHLQYDTDGCQQAGQLDASKSGITGCMPLCLWKRTPVYLNVHSWACSRM